MSKKHAVKKLIKVTFFEGDDLYLAVEDMQEAYDKLHAEFGKLDGLVVGFGIIGEVWVE